MKKYSNRISLTKNSRGVYSIDPSIGCKSGTKKHKLGCYGDCYAARIAKLYGYDFSNTVYRNFKSISELFRIRKQIEKIKLPFIRMGTMGDPSENWENTLNICELLQLEYQLHLFNWKPKEIVIITKHWNNLTNNQLLRLKKLNICINTSISVLDENIENAINQYEILKDYCRSILRIVSCDFNTGNKTGLKLHKKQEKLFSKYNMLDTVFRPSKSNGLIENDIIKIHKTKFLGKNSYVSKRNKKTYLGKCDTCLEMCGINL